MKPEEQSSSFWFTRCFWGGLGLACATVIGFHLWDFSSWLIHVKIPGWIEAVREKVSGPDLIVLTILFLLLVAFFMVQAVVSSARAVARNRRERAEKFPLN